MPTIPPNNNTGLYNTTGNALPADGNISANNITASGNVTVGGYVSAVGNVITDGYFIGDGSQLTGLPATYGNSNVAAYLPTYTGNLSAGNLTLTGSSNITNDLTVGGTIYGTFSGNISGNLVVPGSNTQVIYNNNGNAGASAGLTFNSDANLLYNGGDITAVGNIITANYFIGNGSQLTGLPDGYSNANVDSHLAAFGSNTISTTGNITAGYVFGNGSQLTGLPATYSNANVDSHLAAFGSNTISTTGNVTVGYIIGDGSQLTNLPAGDYSNANVAAYLPTYTGNITANTISASGNVTGAYIIGDGSQLTNLPAGDYSNANVDAHLAAFGSNTISTTGNVTAGYFAGNGSLLTNLTGANISGTVANATYATSAGSATSATTAGTVTNAAQGNITSVGTLTGLTVGGDSNITGNLVVGQDLTVNGNTIYTNITELNVQDPIISQGRGANNTPLTSNDGKDRGEQFWYYTSEEKSAFSGYDNSAGKILLATDVSIANEIVTVNSLGNIVGGNIEATSLVTSGNVTGSYIVGNGSLLSSLTGANVSGTVANATSATTAGTVTGNAQANITSVGTLTSLSVSGNVTAGNISTAGVVYTPQVESASDLDLNTTGQVNVNGNLRIGDNNTNTQISTHGAGDLILRPHDGAANQGSIRLYHSANGNIDIDPNGTGVVNLGGIVNATGNITSAANISGAYLLGNGSQITGLPAAYSNADVNSHLAAFGSNTISTTGNVTAGNITGVNFIGNGSQLTSLTGANVTGTVANATYATSAGSATTAGTVTGNAQANITSVGTLTSLSVSGNVTASYVIGNGSRLTNLPGANVTGTVPNANYANTVLIGAQPNITSVGNLTSITTSGNINLDGTIVFGANAITLTTSSPTSGFSGVAIGPYARYANNTSSTDAIAIGRNAGKESMSPNGIAIGQGAGQDYQGGYAIAIGLVAGKTNQGLEAIAIGESAGEINQGNVTVAIGRGAGFNNQGDYAIAIGDGAGNLDQATNSIILNANSGTDLNAANSGLYIMPVRNDTGNVTNAVYYNTTTKEVTYGPAGSGTTYGDANVNTLLAAWGSNALSTTGNVTAGYVVGNGSLLTNLTGANVTGTVASATSATTAGTVTGNAQANITSVGTLTALSVTGNIATGGILTDNYYYANGTPFTGGGGGTYGDANVNTLLAAWGSNSLSTTGNVTTGRLVSGAVTYANTDGTNGQVLTTYGNGVTYFSTVGGGSGAPGGADTQIQYNDAGAFNGNALMTFNDTTGNINFGNLQIVSTNVITSVNSYTSNTTPNPARINVGSGKNGDYSNTADVGSNARGARMWVVDEYVKPDNGVRSRELIATGYANLNSGNIGSANANSRLGGIVGEIYVINGNSLNTSLTTVTGISGTLAVGQSANTANATVGGGSSVLGFVNVNAGSSANNLSGVSFITTFNGNVSNWAAYAGTTGGNATVTGNAAGFFHPGATATMLPITTGAVARKAANYHAFRNDDDLAQSRLGSLSRFHELQYTQSSSSGSITLDKNNAQVQYTTPTEDITTVAFSNFVTRVQNGAATGYVYQADTVTWIIRQGATPYSITMPTGTAYKYAAGVSAVPATANAVVMISITGVYNTTTSANEYLITISPEFS